MDILVKQKRVRFSGPRKGNQKEFHGTRERTLPSRPPQIESFSEDNKAEGWFKSQFSGRVSRDYDSREVDQFATAVAAAAFAIHSLDEPELSIQMKLREELEASRTKIKSRKDGNTTGQPSSGRATRRFSSMEMKNAETVSINNSMGQEEAQERAFPIRRPSRISSLRHTSSADRYKNQVGSSSRHNDADTKADAWEKAKMEKIKKRYVKMNSRILAWENEKKMQAKLKMERIKGELEQRRALNLHHFQIKIARIDQIGGGARGLAEEKRRNEEFEVKENAKKIRSIRNVPVKCFCFYCH